MDCHYHPGREAVTTCTVCGKPICSECSMEIAGKTYCKDCLERIIGMNEASINQNIEQSTNPISDTLQEMEPQYNPYEQKIETPSFNDENQTREQIIGDVLGGESYDNSPYSLDNFQYPGSPVNYDNPYQQDNQNSYYQEDYYPTIDSPQTPTEPNTQYDDGFIYPDHSYQPPEMPNRDMGKYETYLDDLYIEEPELPLSEQIARDEEVYGSLTKSPYESRNQETYFEGEEYAQYIPPNGDYQEQGFLNISNVTHNNPQGDFIQQRPPVQQPNYNQSQSPRQSEYVDKGIRPSTRSIHNVRNMETEKEPYGAVDILLTIILIVLIILVVFYVVYIFFLSSTYPTFADALIGLKDPGTFFKALTGK